MDNLSNLKKEYLEGIVISHKAMCRGALQFATEIGGPAMLAEIVTKLSHQLQLAMQDERRELNESEKKTYDYLLNKKQNQE